MIENPNNPRSLHEHYHRVVSDEIVKSIFNSGKSKEGEGMKIPEWMLTEEMTLTANYRMTTSAPRTPNPATTERESSDQHKPTVIRFHVQRRPNPETPIPTTAEIDIDSLDEAKRLSIATQRILGDLEAQQNVEKVKKHMVDEEIEKLLEGNENVDVETFMDEETKDTPPPTPIRSPRTHIAPLSMDKETLQELTATAQDAPSSLDKEKLKELTEVLPSMVDKWVNEITKTTILDDEKLRNDDLSIWWSLKIKFEKPTPSATPCRTIVIRIRDHEDHHDDDARPKGESSTKRQKTFEHCTYSVGSGTQEQLDEFHTWTEDLGTDDDGVPTEEVSPELMEEISGEIDEAQLLSLPTPKKPTRVFQSCQRDPKAPPMTLLNQDLFYLKHGNSGPKKYILSLHKYPAVPFPEDDIEERTSRWKMWAKQDYIRRQKEQRDKPEEVYLESKIVEVIRTSYELGHKHKFITEIVVRRANGKIDPIIELDYKHLIKNDIEELYLLCINGKVKDYRETGLIVRLYQKHYHLGKCL
ncbi:hypothetical protein Tco_0393776 [Tanacetum coccineum]